MTISATTRGLRPGVCTSTNRPAVPFDGMLIYETDTNRVAVYDTNAWVYKTPDTTVGSVLQVVSATKTDTFTTTSTSYTDITGLSVSITPKFSTSKILVFYSVQCQGVNTVNLGGLNLVRGSTNILLSDAAGSRIQASNIVPALTAEGTPVLSNSYLDSPSTTSSTTYKMQIRTGGAGTLYVNQTQTDANQNTFFRGTSSITLMEIAG